MKIVITGSTGFIGKSLISFLTLNGHEVIRLLRTKSHTLDDENVHDAYWDPEHDLLDENILDGTDAIVHLAGENIHGCWSDEKKQRILSSRIKTTSLIANAILNLKNPPKTLISASGISYYGNDITQRVNETHPAGTDFLAQVCNEWESASDVLLRTNTRVVNLRIGAVMGKTGGMLEKLIPIFKMGFGGKWGSGKQHISWIVLDDLLRVILLALTDDTLTGSVNAVSPIPVTNKQFTETLGRIFSRPTLLCIPEKIAKLAFGDWADSTLLANYEVIPKVLLDKQFKFQFTDLEKALRHSTNRT
ncbi:TIGR01777 family oxidoreductase [archaeon]|nr:TIGR01777 family oxidoreductase [archaeon]